MHKMRVLFLHRDNLAVKESLVPEVIYNESLPVLHHVLVVPQLSMCLDILPVEILVYPCFLQMQSDLLEREDRPVKSNQKYFNINHFQKVLFEPEMGP